jgi:hypothetical protein
MQKKKRSFQVIPNCGVNGVTNWNVSKEVPVEQGCDDIGLRNSPNAAGSIRTVNRHRQMIAALSRLEPNCSILTRKWCNAIASWTRITAALFIEHSSEI